MMTELQVYGSESGVVDFTCKKLIRLITSSTMSSYSESMRSILEGYLSGRMAVGWNGGEPFWIPIQKDD